MQRVQRPPVVARVFPVGKRIDMSDVGHDDMVVLGKRVVYISGVRPDLIGLSRRAL